MASSSPPHCLWLSFLLLLQSNSLPFLVAEPEEVPKHVLTLDASNFTKFVSTHHFIVVSFYAPWCGACKTLEPLYENAASALSQHDPPVILAKVDATDQANKDLVKEYEVKGYPTIKILRKGGKNIQDYKGSRRTTNDIIEYVKKNAGPSSIEIRSSEQAESIIDRDKVFVVGVFSKFSGDEFDNYISVSEKLRSDYDFGHTLEVKILPQGGHKVERPFIRLIKPFDELFVDFHDFGEDALENFIIKSSIPLVTIFTQDPKTHQHVTNFFRSDNDKAMLFLNFSGQNFDAFQSKYQEIAKDYEGQSISFLLGDLDASDGAMRFFKLEKDEVPLIIVQDKDQNNYLKTHVEPIQLAAWLKDYMDGNLKPYLKSAPIPDVNNDPVKVVVANSLHDVVYKSGKNVLLEFYAPWCRHCRSLAPVLEEVAVFFGSDPDIVVAKLDVTENDVSPEFNVKGYPTMYFLSKSGKLVEYDGGRTKEEIIEFIQKNRVEVVAQNDGGPPLKDEL